MRRKLEKFSDFIENRFKTITFISGILFAILFYFLFDISVFEGQKNQFYTKKIISFYKNQGDLFLDHNEYTLAKEAYEYALELAPHDYEAIYGLAKSKIFDPPNGKKYINNEIILYRIELLEKEFPKDEHIYIFKAQVEKIRGNFTKAILYIKKAIEIDSLNADAYSTLAYLYQCNKHYDLDEISETYEKALKLNPNKSIALLNCGYMNMYSLQFDSAFQNLKKSANIVPNFTNYLGLAYLYRISGNYERSTELYEYLHEKLERNIESDEYDISFYGGELMLNFFPLSDNDKLTPKNYVMFYNLKQYKGLLEFELGINYALQKKLNKAEKLYAEGVKHIGIPYYFKYFKNQIKFLDKYSIVPIDKNWFNKWYK